MCNFLNPNMFSIIIGTSKIQQTSKHTENLNPNTNLNPSCFNKKSHKPKNPNPNSPQTKIRWRDSNLVHGLLEVEGALLGSSQTGSPFDNDGVTFLLRPEPRNSSLWVEVFKSKPIQIKTANRSRKTENRTKPNNFGCVWMTFYENRSDWIRLFFKTEPHT